MHIQEHICTVYIATHDGLHAQYVCMYGACVSHGQLRGRGDRYFNLCNMDMQSSLSNVLVSAMYNINWGLMHEC